MRYKIIQNNTIINTIEADEAFCITYCADNGYSYEADPLPNQETISSTPDNQNNV